MTFMPDWDPPSHAEIRDREIAKLAAELRKLAEEVRTERNRNRLLEQERAGKEES